MIRGLSRPSGRLLARVRRRAKSSASRNPSPPLPYKSKHGKPSSKDPPTGSSDETRTPTQRARSFNPRTVIFGGLCGFITTHLFTKHIAAVHPCAGPSMLPTMDYSGEWVLISKLHGTRQWIHVGDLVSFTQPSAGYGAIKRVIGMPGDFVLRDTPGKGDGTMVRVPPGHCWVVGDNFNGSRDSRMYGAVSLSLVKGKVISRIWPNPRMFGGYRDFTEPTVVEDEQD